MFYMSFKYLIMVSIFLFAGCGRFTSEKPASSLSSSDLISIKPTIPLDWKQVQTTADFNFLVPNDMNPSKIQPFDSYVELYKNDFMAIMFDFGLYSKTADTTDELIDGKNAKIEVTESNYIIDGKSYKYISTLRFMDIGRGNAHLTFSGYFNDIAVLETSKNIFRSIKFNDSSFH